jgi:hypothetical protein
MCRTPRPAISTAAPNAARPSTSGISARSYILRRFFAHLVTNKLQRSNDSSFDKAMLALTPEQQALFATAIVSSAVAITFNNAVLGMLFRRVFWVLSLSPPKPTIDDNRVKAFFTDLAHAA